MPKPPVGQNRVFRREYLLISRVNCTQATAIDRGFTISGPRKKWVLPGHRIDAGRKAAAFR